MIKDKLRDELIKTFKGLSSKSLEEIARVEKRKQAQEKYLSELNDLFIDLNNITLFISNLSFQIGLSRRNKCPRSIISQQEILLSHCVEKTSNIQSQDIFWLYGYSFLSCCNSSNVNIFCFIVQYF